MLQVLAHNFSGRVLSGLGRYGVSNLNSQGQRVVKSIDIGTPLIRPQPVYGLAGRQRRDRLSVARRRTGGAGAGWRDQL